MHPKALSAIALSVMVYCLRGERTAVIPKDDGYLITTHVAVWRYGVDLTQPEPIDNNGSLYYYDGRPNAFVSCVASSDLITEVQSSEFVRKDTLTPEEVTSFEQCIKYGPLIEWSVLGPVQKYNHPEPEPETVMVASAPTPPEASFEEPIPTKPETIDMASYARYIGGYPTVPCPFLPRGTALFFSPELIRA